MDKKEAIVEMNKLGQSNRPFLFIIGFDNQKNIVLPLDEVDSDEIKYEFNDGFSNYQNFKYSKTHKELKLEIAPISFEKYKSAFDFLKDNLIFGNSFLTNLTASTPIETNMDLEEILFRAKAKFKLYLKDQFVCFSPESFVSVDKNGKISSFPMKGTIDDSIENAEELILKDPKEKYEHTTIVDLIRNDLSGICEKVWVEKFRFVDNIKKEDGRGLLQISSEVCGQLPADWKSEIGDWFFKLLPAGSITGAPKCKTLEIIQEAEKELHLDGKRGFYTGVFGLFDGEILTSAVLIRFIEQTKNGLVYKSGGGITSRSDAQKEYEELIQKIYVPVF